MKETIFFYHEGIVWLAQCQNEKKSRDMAERHPERIYFTEPIPEDIPT